MEPLGSCEQLLLFCVLRLGDEADAVPIRNALLAAWSDLQAEADGVVPDLVVLAEGRS